MIAELLRQLAAKYGYVQMSVLTDDGGTVYDVALYDHALCHERMHEIKIGRHIAAYHSSLVSMEDALRKAVGGCGPECSEHHTYTDPCVLDGDAQILAAARASNRERARAQEQRLLDGMRSPDA